jgi:hypothetical protein
VSNKVAGLVAVISLLTAPAALAKDDDKQELGPGCDPDRPAIAHHAGGIRVAHGREANAPIPCSTNTGFRTSEIGLVVTNSGSIVGFQPALQTGLPFGVLRSVDQGETWDLIFPASPNAPPRITAVDENLAIDRTTGRIFWESPGYELPGLLKSPGWT